MTHLQQIQKENKEVKAKIEELLGWDNSTFCHFQEAMGYAYLESEVMDALAVKELVYLKTFWSWWKNQWVKRDIQFLRDVMAMGTNINRSIYRADKIVNTYTQYHRTQAILFIPHKEVMRKSYARFIGKLNKQIVNG